MFDIKKLTDRQIDQIHEFPADSGNYFIGWDDHQAELDAQQAHINILEAQFNSWDHLEVTQQARIAELEKSAPMIELVRQQAEIERLRKAEQEWQDRMRIAIEADAELRAEITRLQNAFNDCTRDFDTQVALVERLKGAMEAAVDKWMTEFAMRENAENNQEYAEFKLAKAQSDLAAHALALKETKQELQDLSYRAWISLHPTISLGHPNEINFVPIGRMSLEESIEHIKTFLARPLSSYQERAERLEAAAKAGRKVKELGYLGVQEFNDAISDLEKDGDA